MIVEETSKTGQVTKTLGQDAQRGRNDYFHLLVFSIHIVSMSTFELKANKQFECLLYAKVS